MNLVAMTSDDATLAARQEALQREAGMLLAAIAGRRTWRRTGPLLPMGSYVSGLMCWRDLDVGTLVGPNFAPADVLSLVGELIATSEVTGFSYRDERDGRSPTGERRDERYHVPVQIVWNSAEWRFDLSLWLYDDHRHVADWHRQPKVQITPDQRRRVLRIKDAWCRRPEYPDEVSGSDIYVAVLDHDVSTADEFASWLLTRQSK